MHLLSDTPCLLTLPTVSSVLPSDLPILIAFFALDFRFPPDGAHERFDWGGGVVLHVEVGDEGPPTSWARLVKLSSSHGTPRWAVPAGWSLSVSVERAGFGTAL